jgi:ArsR family transcriptional regulator
MGYIDIGILLLNRTSGNRMKTLRKDSEHATQAASRLKALGHPLRLQIISILSENDAHVNALAEELGVPQSAVSQHLRILRMEGLVGAERRDGFAFYHLTEPKIKTLLACIESCDWR